MDTEEIRRRVDRVLQRIRLACERVGRDPDEVTLVAVTKTFPESVILSACDAGLRHIGENKPQEFARKFEAVEPVVGDLLSWHFIGHLQRNKVKLVAGRAHLVHGVDSLRLTQALNDFAEKEDLLLKCLIQVNVSGEESKFGLAPSALNTFLAETRALERLSFDGLMTLASPTDDTSRIRREFRLLRKCLSEGKETVDSLRHLSMGMSGDYEIAVEEGATHVRLGSALFGSREG